MSVVERGAQANAFLAALARSEDISRGDYAAASYRPPKDECTALCACDRHWLIVFGALLLLTLVAIFIALLRRAR